MTKVKIKRRDGIIQKYHVKLNKKFRKTHKYDKKTRTWEKEKPLIAFEVKPELRKLIVYHAKMHYEEGKKVNKEIRASKLKLTRRLFEHIVKSLTGKVVTVYTWDRIFTTGAKSISDWEIRFVYDVGYDNNFKKAVVSYFDDYWNGHYALMVDSEIEINHEEPRPDDKRGDLEFLQNGEPSKYIIDLKRVFKMYFDEVNIK